MAGLAEFLDCVVEVDADLTASEIADAFWLAEKMEALQSAATAVATGLAAAAPTGPLGPAESGTASGPAAKEPQPAEGLPPPAAPAAGGGSGGPTKSGEPIPVFHDDPAGAADLVAAGLPTVPLALAMPRELRRPLNLQRGLRPLMRTVRSGPATVLDEGATAVLSARALAVMPALVAAGERWLDLALVIDTSPSMALWGSLVRELRVALSQFGAFRAVRTWRLAFDGGKPLVRTEAAWSTARAPRELIDPTGRQVVLVLTDCIAQPWWPKSGPNGGMLMDETLEAWAGTGPLAILQPLPQRMWARCGMAGHSTRLRSPFPGAPNSSLLTDRAATRWAGQRAADFGRTRRGVPIPVLEIDQRWLASWSRLISSTSPERVAVAFTGAPRPDYDPGGPERPSPQLDEEDQARWLVRQFRSVASPEAFRLAGLLAAAPLTLPLMRLIQRVLCTDDRQVPLAEVLLGGLLRDVTPAGEPMASFAFLPHVRDMLLDTIRRSEAIRVRELVAEELSRGRGAGRSGYVARVPVVPGTTGTALTTTRDIWIAIDAKVLSRIGGRYAQVVLGTGQDALAARTQAPAEPEVLVPPPAREQATRQETATEKTSGLLDAAGRREAPVPDGDMQGLVMLGGPGSGKTTYLAALSIALIRGPGWRLIPRDDLSTEMLTDGVLDLIRRRVFPRATDEITNYHWKLAGEIDRGWRPGSGRRLETVSLDLRVTEATGEIFTRHQPGRRASLIEELVRSAGIIFLFDPTREFEVGDTIDYVLQVVALLRRRALSEGALADDRLKQYVAVCMSKFDDHHVFRSAERMGLVSYSSRDPYGFPRVADASARRFLQELCRLAPSETAELAISTLEKSFLPARIRYFVTSAIGFHLDRRTRKFNREDPSNYQDYLLDDGSGAKRVRGSVYPINVAEPLVWLNEQLAKPSS
jgi:hypothetical protein